MVSLVLEKVRKGGRKRDIGKVLNQEAEMSLLRDFYNYFFWKRKVEEEDPSSRWFASSQVELRSMLQVSTITADQAYSTKLAEAPFWMKHLKAPEVPSKLVYTIYVESKLSRCKHVATRRDTSQCSTGRGSRGRWLAR